MFREFFSLTLTLAKALTSYDASKILNLSFYWPFPQFVRDRKNFFRVTYFSRFIEILKRLQLLACKCNHSGKEIWSKSSPSSPNKLLQACSLREPTLSLFFCKFHQYSFQHKFQSVGQFILNLYGLNIWL